MKRAFLLLKAVIMLLLDMVCIYIICVLAGNFYYYVSWHELGFEYVGEMEYEGIDRDRKLCGAEPKGASSTPFPLWDNGTEPEECGKKGFWFYRIKDEREWEYYCSLFGIQDTDMELCFDNHYVFSVNRRLTRLQYNNTRWDVEEYGSSVRPDFDMDSYEDGKIYLYQLEKDEDFYFNFSDYKLGRYNYNKEHFFIDAIKGEIDGDYKDGWEPFCICPVH